MIRRLKRSTVVMAGIVGLMTAAGFAFFVGSFAADGSHEGTIGSGGTGTKTLPVSLNWEDGKLSPTVPVPLTATINNTAKKQITFHKVQAIFTSTTPGCEAKWFKVNSSSERWSDFFANPNMAGEFVYAPGSHSIGQEVGVEGAGPTFTVAMTESAVDQSACEGGSLKLQMKFTE